MRTDSRQIASRIIVLRARLRDVTYTSLDVQDDDPYSTSTVRGRLAALASPAMLTRGWLEFE